MTGFGRSENQKRDLICKAEIRSVNNRFFDFNPRFSKSLLSLEPALRNLVKSRCARGSFDLTINLESCNGNGRDQIIQPNLPLATQYIEAFHQIKKHLRLNGEIDINSILSLKDILKVEPLTMDESSEELILSTVELALASLVKMREAEGKNLEEDIMQRLEAIHERAEIIKSRQSVVIQEYKERLRERVRILTEGMEIDDVRLAQETAILSDRCDVTEEIIRLESHLKQFKSLIESQEPLGRKLEFITQEINRETNTIGSKTIDPQVSQSVIEIKCDLEKIREQLQNIE
ncbi:MAG: YicC/YloC family endoribonuclease [Nitrospinaceae bacterium]